MHYKKLLPLTNKLLKNELKVDLGSISFQKDITSNLLLKKNSKLEIAITPREEIIICGIYFIEDFIKKNLPELKFKKNYFDGDLVKKNNVIALISGNSLQILAIERTILNFLQNLSSISSTTKKVVDKLKHSRTQLLDTRKTITGLRILQKYATLTGGAKNHRIGLYDDILIKDNHIKAAGGLNQVIKKLKKKKIKKYKIECDSIKQVKNCIDNGAKYILLDNMKPRNIVKSIKLKKYEKIMFEITGGIKLNNIKKYSNLNADFISAGFITQNPLPVDIAMDMM